MIYYLNPSKCGTDAVSSFGDGTSINLKWFKAYSDSGLNIYYNIYYSTIKENVYSEGIKYISIGNSIEANIIDLIPGQEYFFSVRPVESNIDYSFLPIAYDNLRIVPQTLLKNNIGISDMIIPVIDTYEFPNSGIIKFGTELIKYDNIDHINGDLLLGERGYNNTDIRIHNTDGYDGYYYQDPIIQYSISKEYKEFDRIFVCQSRFEYPNYQRTDLDGYHQVVKDLLHSDLQASDDDNVDFESYDYSGYHRTDPVLLLNGTCVGSYIGGQKGCIDKYGNVNMVRGFDLQDANNEREEVLLSITGRPAVLLKRMRTGITCACYQPSRERGDDRCPKCLGGKFVLGWEQYFNPRRSDGRIMVRVSPSDDATKQYEAGLESELNLDGWTLTVPTIHMRDVLILFDINDNEEFRYEVGAVTRNNTILGQQGAQKFKMTRVRKFDPIYQINAFRNTSMYPETVNTSVAFTIDILPHTHTFQKNEKSDTGWSQLSGVSQGHNHQLIIKDGVLTVLPALGHTHTLVL